MQGVAFYKDPITAQSISNFASLPASAQTQLKTAISSMPSIQPIVIMIQYCRRRPGCLDDRCAWCPDFACIHSLQPQPSAARAKVRTVATLRAYVTIYSEHDAGCSEQSRLRASVGPMSCFVDTHPVLERLMSQSRQAPTYRGACMAQLHL